MRVRLADLPDVVAYADPASGKRGEELKRARARSAIVVLGQDTALRIFVLHCWVARASTDAFMDRMLEIFQTYTPRLFGIEANGMQSIFGDSVERWALDRGIRIPFVPVHQPTNVKKEWRIRTQVQPVLGQGRLLFDLTQPGQVELHAEMQGFPNYPTVDAVDALGSALGLLPERTAADTIREEEQGLAAYLRDSGARPAEIEARLATLRRERSL